MTKMMTRLQCATGTAAVISKINQPCPSASTKPEPIETINISTKKRDSINQTEKSTKKNDINVENNRSEKMTSSIQAIGDSRTDRDCVQEKPAEDLMNTLHLGCEPVISESDTGQQCPTELLEKVDDVPAEVSPDVGPDCPPQVNKGSDIPAVATICTVPTIPDCKQDELAIKQHSNTITSVSCPPIDKTKTDGQRKKWSGWTRLVAGLSVVLLLGLVSAGLLFFLVPTATTVSPIAEIASALESATACKGTGWKIPSIWHIDEKTAEIAMRKAEAARDVLTAVVNAVIEAPAFN